MSTQAVGWVGAELAGGRYRVVSKLGEGGMGFVYRAWDANLDTDVVIKVPRRAMLDEPGFAERFSREIRSLVRLSHPHIVKALDVGVHDGLPFAVLQFLSGGSLEDRRLPASQGPQRRMAPGSLRDWLAHVAAALDFIHAQQYVHRDVKPANILFDAHGHSFLSDFGVAKVIAARSETDHNSSLTGTGLVLGTPHYMAPELVMGQAFDGRVDQYALAVTIHELLAGQPPIDGTGPTAILVQQTMQPPPALHTIVPGIPEALSMAVLKALSKDQRQRYPTCTQFAEEVLAALRYLSGASAPPVPERPPSRVSHGTRGNVSCPACQTVLQLTENLRNSHAACPTCQTPILISDDLCHLTEMSHAEAAWQPQVGAEQNISQQSSGAADTSDFALGHTATVSSAHPRRKKPSNTRTRYLVVASAICAVFVVGLLILGFSAGTRSQVVLLPIADQTIESDKAFAFTYKAEVRDSEKLNGRLVYSLSGEPQGLTINPHTGLIRVIPNGRTLRESTYTITVGVAVEGSPDRRDSTEFALTVKPSPPSPPQLPALALQWISDQTTYGDEVFNLQAAVDHAERFKATDTFHYELIGGPPGMTIDVPSGMIYWRPTKMPAPGIHTIAVRVNLESAPTRRPQRTFTLKVEPPRNHPPTVEILRVEPAEPMVNSTVLVDVTGADPDHDPVQLQYRVIYLYSMNPQIDWQPIPDGKKIELNGKKLPAGKLRIEVRGQDSLGLQSAIVSCEINVRAPHHNGKLVSVLIKDFEGNAQGYYRDSIIDKQKLDQEMEAVSGLIAAGRTQPAAVDELLAKFAEYNSKQYVPKDPSTAFTVECLPIRCKLAVDMTIGTDNDPYAKVDAIEALASQNARVVTAKMRDPPATFRDVPEKGQLYLRVVQKIGEPAIPNLVRGLDDGRLSDGALAVLSNLGPPAIPSLLGAFKHASPEVRRGAIWAMACDSVLQENTRRNFASTVDVAKAAEALCGALGDPDVTVQWFAAHSIVGLGLRSDESVKDLLPFLEKMLEGQPRESNMASFLLGALGPTAESMAPALGKAVRDGKCGRTYELSKLGQGGKTVLIGLLKYKRDDPKDTHARSIRYEAAGALGGWGATPKAVLALADALDDPDVKVQVQAVKSLTTIGPSAKAAIPDLQRFKDDPNTSDGNKFFADKAIKSIETGKP